MRGPVMSRRRAMIAGGLALSGAVARPALASPGAAVGAIASEDGRSVRITTWPAVGSVRGVILFSHGALSAPEKYERLIVPWTEAGFTVSAPLHVDSTDHPDHARYGMVDSWRARLLDMRALSRLQTAPAYIAVGHSYGALVALTLGGAEAIAPPGLAAPLRDPRAKAVVAFSPPGPSPGLITAEGYAGLATPALIQTGDRDIPFGTKDGEWRVHLTAFDAAPAGDKYALVLPGVDHYFGGLICNFDRPGPPRPEQLATAARLSTDFLRAYGADDRSARRRLDRAVGDDGAFKLTRK